MVCKVSFFPILGMLFHPSYMMINTVWLGQHKPDTTLCNITVNGTTSWDTSKIECVKSSQYVAAFGLSSSAISIIQLAPGLCFALGLINVIPQAHGSGETKLIGAYANRMTIIVGILSVINLAIIWGAGPFLFEALSPVSNGVKDPWVGKLATEYSRYISIGVMFYHFASCFIFMSNGMG